MTKTSHNNTIIKTGIINNNIIAGLNNLKLVVPDKLAQKYR